MSELKTEIERLDLEMLIRYGVREEERTAALKVLEKYKENRIAVAVLRSYYSDLPDAREEMAVDLKLVAAHLGAFLLVLESTSHNYFYLGTEEKAVFLGDFNEGISDEQLLDHFGFGSIREFNRKIGSDPANLPSLSEPPAEKPLRTCVVCGVEVGEPHILGCPVEPCPWCESQLSRCNCRFDQLGVSDIEDEELLDRFEKILEHKGRIVFATGQNPSYPTAGDDPGPRLTDEK